MNPDAHRFLRIDTQLSPALFRQFLSRSLNAALFLCNHYVVLPPTFVFESSILTGLLITVRPLFEANVIRLPMREKEVAEVFEKKIREYSEDSVLYKRINSSGGRKALKLLSDFAMARIPRDSNVGMELARRCSTGSDRSEYWRKQAVGLATGSVQRLERLPTEAYESGKAVTWSLISTLIHRERDQIADDTIHNVIQHEYTSIYTEEYDLAVMTGLPFFLDGFGHNDGLFYDFQALRDALSPISLFEVVMSLPPAAMLALRYTAGYVSFISAYYQLAVGARSRSTLRDRLAMALGHPSAASKHKARLTNISKRDEKSIIEVTADILFEAGECLRQSYELAHPR